jgi:predicted DNA-binding transcriptional regulator AlpA
MQIQEFTGTKPDPFFDNLKGWMRPHEVAEKFGISVWTIYRWKNRGKLAGVPEDLFIKFNRSLFVRTDILRLWISSQNSNGKIPPSF